MLHTVRTTLLLALILGLTLFDAVALAQRTPARKYPNPYREVDGLHPPANMNKGEWGELIGVNFDGEGNIWVLHRCFAAVLGRPDQPKGWSDGVTTNCKDSNQPPLLKFSPSGKLLMSLGQGMFVRPHGLYVDREGNLWATDDSFITTVPGKGHVVYKWSPQGKLLMTLGTPGVPGESPTTFHSPTDVVTVANGDIFVTDGESDATHIGNDRVVKFSKDGRFIKAWGKRGPARGEFNNPHSIAIDSQERLFVADRGNKRIQIFDQEGRFLDEWKQFGGASQIFIAKDDTMYVTGPSPDTTENPGRGIYVGNAKTGAITAFIPDPDEGKPNHQTSGSSGVTGDAGGNTIYTADVAPRKVRKFLKQ